MRKFHDIFKKTYILTKKQWGHIQDRHPEITIEIISKCLLEPTEVRKRVMKDNSCLYYSFKAESRFYCVVTVECKDANYISTSYTCDMIKAGKVIYKR